MAGLFNSRGNDRIRIDPMEISTMWKAHAHVSKVMFSSFAFTWRSYSSASAQASASCSSMALRFNFSRYSLEAWAKNSFRVGKGLIRSISSIRA